MKVSPRPIPFDLALKERLLPPKNGVMSQLSESKGGKLKKSICRQKHKSVQKRAVFRKPCNPLWPYQPGQKRCGHRSAAGGMLEKDLFGEELCGEMSASPDDGGHLLSICCVPGTAPSRRDASPTLTPWGRPRTIPAGRAHGMGFCNSESTGSSEKLRAVPFCSSCPTRSLLV